MSTQASAIGVDPAELLNRAREEWEAGAEPDARAVIDRHPELARRKSAMLDLAYLEYLTRQQRGEEIDAKSFCGRFPGFAHSLARTISVHRLILENEDLLSAAGPPWPTPGDAVEGCELMAVLGQGGLARAYLAWQPGAERHVVVKLSPDDPGEARSLGRLRHPNVVELLHTGHDDASGMAAVIMPYRGPATLADLLDEPAGPEVPASVVLAAAASPHGLPAPPGEDPHPVYRGGTRQAALAHIGSRVARALEYLHANDIRHGDLKPTNVVLTPAGEPILIDFNLSEDGRMPDRRLGGTLPYLAPEQLEELAAGRPVGRVTVAAELYSLGAMLYELLAGSHPFGLPPEATNVRDAAAALCAARRAGAGPLRRAAEGVDRRLARLIEACLSENPEARPRSAARVAEALEAVGPSRPPRRLGLTAAAAVMSVSVWLTPPAVPDDPALPAGRAALDPGEALRRARGMFAEKQYAAAAETLKPAADGNQDDTQMQILYGRSLIGAGRFKAARRVLERVIARHGEKAGPEAYAALAYSLNVIAEGRPSKTAMKHLETALELGADDPATVVNFAYNAMQSGSVKDNKIALDRIDDLIHKDSSRWKIRLARASLLFRLIILYSDHSRVSEAYRDINYVLKSDPVRACDLPTDLCSEAYQIYLSYIKVRPPELPVAAADDVDAFFPALIRDVIAVGAVTAKQRALAREMPAFAGLVPPPGRWPAPPQGRPPSWPLRLLPPVD